LGFVLGRTAEKSFKKRQQTKQKKLKKQLEKLGEK
jgi:hypothetical protein